MPLTKDERDELRTLQDRWLALPVVKHQIRLYGETEPIAGGYPGARWPTYREVRELLHPDLREWFADFFREG